MFLHVFLVFLCFINIQSPDPHAPIPVVKSEAFSFLTDNQLAIAVSLGTPEQSQMFIIDIGTPKTWMYKGIYDPTKSSTYSTEDKTAKFTQDMFSFEGKVIKEKFTFSEIEMNNYEFLMPEQITGSNQFLLSIGLGRSSVFIDKMAKELESERTFMLQFYKDQYKGVLHIGDLSEELKIKANKIDSIPLIENDSNKWMCQMKYIFIGDYDYQSDKAKKKLNETDNKEHFIIDTKDYEFFSTEYNATFETIYSKIYIPSSVKQFLDTKYFIGDLEKVCTAEPEDEKGDIIYKCDKAQKSKIKTINFVFSNGLNVFLKKEDLVICEDNECQFALMYNKNINRFAFGITMLQYFNTFFKLDGNELYLESDGRKYIVDLDNSTEEPKAPSTGLGILKSFLIIVAILVVIFIIFKCIMKRKKVTKKLIEDQIYQTFE